MKGKCHHCEKYFDLYPKERWENGFRYTIFECPYCDYENVI